MPEHPKIYHIVHVDRLPSIISDNHLWCDAKAARRSRGGTVIGMSHIKQRRLRRRLASHPQLHVGDCVPFYFCPRSIMLYVIWQGNNPDLNYTGGQEPIVHLEADLYEVVAWANKEKRRWAFTLSNAGSLYFEDRCDLSELHEIDWNAIRAKYWQDCKEGKQAEFLMEYSFPWHLIERIGVYSRAICDKVLVAQQAVSHKPRVEIKRDWYY